MAVMTRTYFSWMKGAQHAYGYRHPLRPRLDTNAFWPQPLRLLPKPAPKPVKVKPAKHSKRKHGGQMVKRSQRAPGPQPKPVYGPPMPTAKQWQQMRALVDVVYGPPAPTNKQWRQMKQAAKASLRAEIGHELALMIAGKRGIASQGLRTVGA